MPFGVPFYSRAQLASDQESARGARAFDHQEHRTDFSHVFSFYFWMKREILKKKEKKKKKTARCRMHASKWMNKGVGHANVTIDSTWERTSERMRERKKIVCFAWLNSSQKKIFIIIIYCLCLCMRIVYVVILLYFDGVWSSDFELFCILSIEFEMPFFFLLISFCTYTFFASVLDFFRVLFFSLRLFLHKHRPQNAVRDRDSELSFIPSLYSRCVSWKLRSFIKIAFKICSTVFSTIKIIPQLVHSFIFTTALLLFFFFVNSRLVRSRWRLSPDFVCLNCKLINHSRCWMHK